MINCLTNFLFNVQNESSESLDIYIDGEIVDAPTQEFYARYYGEETSTSYKSFRDKVNAASPKTVNIFINSGGGQVADAFAIHDFIVDLQNKGVVVNTFGRGIIASAATYILMASKNSSISKNSWFMIHNVSGVAYGNINEVENTLAMMRKFNNKVRDLYAEYTGKETSTITNWMNKETWFSGSEAVENGFVKTVSGDVAFTNSINEKLWPFTNKAVLNSYNSFTKPVNTDSMEIKNLADSLNAAITNGFATLMEKLGVSNKAGDEGVKNAITEFQTGLVNAVQAAMPTVESLQNLVNEAVTAGIKNIDVTSTEAFQTALTNAVTDATKDLKPANGLTQKDLEAFKNSVIEAVGQKLGNKGAGSKVENKDKNKNEGGERRTSSPNNRFKGQYQSVEE